MQKIGDITPTANAEGEYREGSAEAGIGPTLIKADWLNTVQRELVAVVEAAGLTPNPDKDDQVLEALLKLAVPMNQVATETVAGVAKVATQAQTNSGVDDSTIVTPKKFSSGIAALVVQATELIKGIAKVATQSQTNAGADDTTIITPKKMRLGFAISLGPNGYVVFPTWMLGLVFQWGVVTNVPIATASQAAVGPILDSLLPIAFPTATLAVFAGMNFTTMSTMSAYSPGATIISRSVIRVQNNYTASAGNISWWAVGY